MMIFWRLILAHLLTDFTLQTNFIASWKRKNVWGCLAHSLIFLVCSYILCYGYLTDIWVSIRGIVIIQGWVAIILITIAHFLEDEWRVWTIQKFDSPDSVLFFLWDQFIHILLIFVFAPLNVPFYPEKWVLLFILFVLATHFTTIFVYYMEKYIYGQSEMPAFRKYFSMFVRTLVCCLFLLPGRSGMAVIAVLVAGELMFWILQKKRAALINSLLGNLMAVIFGIIARLVYYHAPINKIFS